MNLWIYIIILVCLYMRIFPLMNGTSAICTSKSLYIKGAICSDMFVLSHDAGRGIHRCKCCSDDTESSEFSERSCQHWGLLEPTATSHVVNFFKIWGGYGSWWKLSYLPVEGNPNGWFLDTDCIHFCLKDEGYFLWKLVDSVSGPLEAPENSAGQCAENFRLMTLRPDFGPV